MHQAIVWLSMSTAVIQRKLSTRFMQPLENPWKDSASGHRGCSFFNFVVDADETAPLDGYEYRACMLPHTRRRGPTIGILIKFENAAAAPGAPEAACKQGAGDGPARLPCASLLPCALLLNKLAEQHRRGMRI